MVVAAEGVVRGEEVAAVDMVVLVLSLLLSSILVHPAPFCCNLLTVHTTITTQTPTTDDDDDDDGVFLL